MYMFKKWGRRDLNPQPLDLESNALPLELRPLAVTSFFQTTQMSFHFQLEILIDNFSKPLYWIEIPPFY